MTPDAIVTSVATTTRDTPETPLIAFSDTTWRVAKAGFAVAPTTAATMAAAFVQMCESDKQIRRLERGNVVKYEPGAGPGLMTLESVIGLG